MGRRARPLVSLTLACAFSSCFAEVVLGVELSPATTSFHQAATSAQPLSFYRSSPHQSTTVHFNSTGPLQTTPVSHRTTEQTREQLQAPSAPGQHRAARAGAGPVSTTPADSAGTASRSTASVTAAVENATAPSASSTGRGRRTLATTGATAAAANTSLKHETASTRGTAASSASAASGTPRAGRSTRSRTQTTAMGAPTAASSTGATRAGTHTAPASTARPPPTPQPSAIPTGTYTLSDGNGTCVKAVMGLQLMARNTQQEQMEYVTVNPNATKISGSCGMVQSELTLTFSRGFVNITFVKQDPSYSVTKIESRMQLSSEGMFYYAVLNEKLFTTKLGNSFKCASRQIFPLERNFQILFVHMQLQAFDIVGNQFGKEEECFPDRNSRIAPIAVSLSILGLFVIVFATFLISRRKPHRGYERI